MPLADIPHSTCLVPFPSPSFNCVGCWPFSFLFMAHWQSHPPPWLQHPIMLMLLDLLPPSPPLSWVTCPYLRLSTRQVHLHVVHEPHTQTAQTSLVVSRTFWSTFGSQIVCFTGWYFIQVCKMTQVTGAQRMGMMRIPGGFIFTGKQVKYHRIGYKIYI